MSSRARQMAMSSSGTGNDPDLTVKRGGVPVIYGPQERGTEVKKDPGVDQCEEACEVVSMKDHYWVIGNVSGTIHEDGEKDVTLSVSICTNLLLFETRCRLVGRTGFPFASESSNQ